MAAQRSKALEIIQDGMAVAELFGVPKHYAQIEVVKEAKRLTNVDYSQLLLSSPEQDDIQDDDIMLEVSHMTPELGCGNGKDVNLLLNAFGLQDRINKQWVPTEKGQSMCVRHSWSKGSKSGYNLKWNLAKVKQVLSNK